ncbi:MAG: glycosyltransferase [Candidatus Binataceae bacterium]
MNDHSNNGAARDHSPGALKVLHVSPSYAPAWGYGGATEAIYQFTRHVALAGAHVKVLTTDTAGRGRRLSAEERRQFERDVRLDVRYCARVGGESVSPELLGCLRKSVAWADVVHLHAAFSFPTIPTLLAARLLARPVVWTLHGAMQHWMQSRRVGAKRAWERVCRAAAPAKLVLHATSDDEAEQALERFGDATAVVIPIGVETPAQIERSRRDGVLRLGFIGRLDPKKGIENLLDACGRLSERQSVPFSLAVAGAGDSNYEQMLRARTVALGIDRRVKFLGDIRGDLKEQFFRNTDVAIVPSFTENFGIVVSEALARAVPVIASTGTPWEHVEQRNCGLWVRNDAQSLANAVERMSGLALDQMGERGRRWMIEEFAWPDCARKLIACYRALLGHHDMFDFETGAAS